MSQESGKMRFMQPKVVLLDIEGTICPISFVKEVLFPYALEALPDIAESQWSSTEFQTYVSAFPSDAQKDPKSLVSCVEQLTRDDVKIASLKNLQGYLWRTGYEISAFSSPLFADVTPALRKWLENGMKLAIYSSGSVDAQKLLLQYVQNSTTPPNDNAADIKQSTTPAEESDSDAKESTTIDIRPLFSAYFDTVNAGSKTEASSYVKILETLDLPAKAGREHTVLFLSDNIKEIRAAEQAGLLAVLVDREGNAPLTEEDVESQRHKGAGGVLRSFEDLVLVR